MADRTPTLGDRIYDERKRRGWSQEKLADYFGINQSSASRWQSGKLNPGEQHIERLADFLDIAEDDIRGLIHDLTPPAATVSQLTEDMLLMLEESHELQAVVRGLNAGLEEVRGEIRDLNRRLERLEGDQDEPEAPCGS